MSHRRRAGIFLVIIATFVAGGAFFVYPKGFGESFLPWRLGLDLVGGSHLVYEVDMQNVVSSDRDSVMNGLRDVIEKRVNFFGVAEPQVFSSRSKDSYRLIVELAGVKDISAAIKQIGETPFLIFAEVVEVGTTTAPATSEEESPAGRQYVPTELTGRYVKRAEVGFDQVTGLGSPEVLLEFNDEGAKIFEALTEKNVGRQIAVFLDNRLITAPVVQQKISGGKAQITGNFTLEEARSLVERFNAGALPAPITLVSQQTVGASLGSNSLAKTLWAGLIGTALVMAFMGIYYGGLGLFAVVALLIYIVVVLAIFKVFSVTMTLSGIAGIILSIGMAVDANILIFERMKEEMARGLGKIPASEEGFRRAWLSIRDSNVTTMITSVILYYLTSGFIRGFALALFIGVVVSMFSAITVTRNLLRAALK